MEQYPKLIGKDTVVPVLQQISRLRDKDVQDRNNFPNVFLSGRSVNKIPGSHSDVAPTDRIGDFCVTPTAAYYLVNDAGTAKWGTWPVDVTW